MHIFLFLPLIPSLLFHLLKRQVRLNTILFSHRVFWILAGAHTQLIIYLADWCMSKYLFWCMGHTACMTYLQSMCFVLLILFIFWIGDRCTWYKIPKVQVFTVKSKSPSLLLQYSSLPHNHWPFSAHMYWAPTMCQTLFWALDMEQNRQKLAFGELTCSICSIAESIAVATSRAL